MSVAAVLQRRLAEPDPQRQERPQRIELPSRAFDLTGQTFGLLRALYPVSKGAEGVWWLCKCECGRLAVRPAVRLRRVGEHQCLTCARELFRGGGVTAREARHERYLLMWAMTGQLYGDLAERSYTEDIRATCVKHDIPFGEPSSDLSDCQVAEAGMDRYVTGVSEKTYLLSEVGFEFGLSRERVRQIQEGACVKLRAHPLILELWDGEPRSPIVPARPSWTTFKGCRCRRWDSVRSGLLYCRLCGKTWALPQNVIEKLLTRKMLDSVTISDEGEDE